MNPTKNLIEPKLYMSSTKNLIEPKLLMNTTNSEQIINTDLIIASKTKEYNTEN